MDMQNDSITMKGNMSLFLSFTPKVSGSYLDRGTGKLDVYLAFPQTCRVNTKIVF
jgi:hypothetical protein